MAREQLDWFEVEADSLSDEQRLAWQAYLQAKAAFKASLQSLSPGRGRAVLFSEKYGTTLKLAITNPPKVTSTPKGTLADFLARHEQNGRAV